MDRHDAEPLAALEKLRRTMTSPDDDAPHHQSEKHLWEHQPIQDLFWIGLGCACLGAAYLLRSATYPVLLALILAYWVMPAVRWASERFGVSRRFVAFVAFAAVTAGFALLLSVVVPGAVRQLRSLSTEVPTQVEQLLTQLGVRELLDTYLADTKDLGSSLRAWAGGAANVLTSVSSAISQGSSFLIQAIFTTALFLYFIVAYDALPEAKVYIPSAVREQTLALLGRFEDAFFGFLRGQLSVALFTTVAYAVGFSLVGVPYAMVAALIGGVLSVIPYGQVAGPISAVLFGVLAASGAGESVDVLRVIVLPFVVYLFSQAMETFVITPLVQGSATQLHPLVIFGAVLCGGSVGGILGVFLAIPLAACGRILLEEVLLPGFRRLANPDGPPTESGDEAGRRHSDFEVRGQLSPHEAEDSGGDFG